MTGAILSGLAAVAMFVFCNLPGTCKTDNARGTHESLLEAESQGVGPVYEAESPSGLRGEVHVWPLAVYHRRGLQVVAVTSL